MTTAAANEITFRDLIAAGCGGASRPVRVQTDAEAYEEHADPARNLFAEFGACHCHGCERHRTATGAL